MTMWARVLGRPWLKGYLTSADLEPNIDLNDSGRRCGKQLLVLKCLSGPDENGCVIKQVTDGIICMKAIFTPQALQDSSQGSETPDWERYLINLQRCALYHKLGQDKSQCDFELIVTSFSFWVSQDFYNTKSMPIPCMEIPEIRRRSDNLWENSRAPAEESQIPDNGEESCNQSCENSIPLTQLLAQMAAPDDTEDSQAPPPESQEPGSEWLTEHTQSEKDKDRESDVLSSNSDSSVQENQIELPQLSDDFDVARLIIPEDQEQILNNIEEWKPDYRPPMQRVATSSSGESEIIQKEEVARNEPIENGIDVEENEVPDFNAQSPQTKKFTFRKIQRHCDEERNEIETDCGKMDDRTAEQEELKSGSGPPKSTSEERKKEIDCVRLDSNDQAPEQDKPKLGSGPTLSSGVHSSEEREKEESASDSNVDKNEHITAAEVSCQVGDSLLMGSTQPGPQSTTTSRGTRMVNCEIQVSQSLQTVKEDSNCPQDSDVSPKPSECIDLTELSQETEKSPDVIVLNSNSGHSSQEKETKQGGDEQNVEENSPQMICDEKDNTQDSQQASEFDKNNENPTKSQETGLSHSFLTKVKSAIQAFNPFSSQLLPSSSEDESIEIVPPSDSNTGSGEIKTSGSSKEVPSSGSEQYEADHEDDSPLMNDTQDSQPMIPGLAGDVGDYMEQVELSCGMPPETQYSQQSQQEEATCEEEDGLKKNKDAQDEDEQQDEIESRDSDEEEEDGLKRIQDAKDKDEEQQKEIDSTDGDDQEEDVLKRNQDTQDEDEKQDEIESRDSDDEEEDGLKRNQDAKDEDEEQQKEIDSRDGGDQEEDVLKRNQDAQDKDEEQDKIDSTDGDDQEEMKNINKERDKDMESDQSEDHGNSIGSRESDTSEVKFYTPPCSQIAESQGWDVLAGETNVSIVQSTQQVSQSDAPKPDFPVSPVSAPPTTQRPRVVQLRQEIEFNLGSPSMVEVTTFSNKDLKQKKEMGIVLDLGKDKLEHSVIHQENQDSDEKRLDRLNHCDSINKDSDEDRLERLKHSKSIEKYSEEDRPERLKNSESIEKDSDEDRLKRLNRSECIEKDSDEDRLEKLKNSESIEKDSDEDRLKRLNRSECIEKDSDEDRLERLKNSESIEKDSDEDRLQRMNCSESIEKDSDEDRLERLKLSESIEKDSEDERSGNITNFGIEIENDKIKGKETNNMRRNAEYIKAVLDKGHGSAVTEKEEECEILNSEMENNIKRKIDYKQYSRSAVGEYLGKNKTKLGDSISASVDETYSDGTETSAQEKEKQSQQFSLSECDAEVQIVSDEVLESGGQTRDSDAQDNSEPLMDNYSKTVDKDVEIVGYIPRKEPEVEVLMMGVGSRQAQEEEIKESEESERCIKETETDPEKEVEKDRIVHEINFVEDSTDSQQSNEENQKVEDKLQSEELVSSGADPVVGSDNAENILPCEPEEAKESEKLSDEKVEVISDEGCVTESITTVELTKQDVDKRDSHKTKSEELIKESVSVASSGDTDIVELEDIENANQREKVNITESNMKKSQPSEMSQDHLASIKDADVVVLKDAAVTKSALQKDKSEMTKSDSDQRQESEELFKDNISVASSKDTDVVILKDVEITKSALQKEMPEVTESDSNQRQDSEELFKDNVSVASSKDTDVVVLEDAAKPKPSMMKQNTLEKYMQTVLRKSPSQNRASFYLAEDDDDRMSVMSCSSRCSTQSVVSAADLPPFGRSRKLSSISRPLSKGPRDSKTIINDELNRPLSHRDASVLFSPSARLKRKHSEPIIKVEPGVKPKRRRKKLYQENMLLPDAIVIDDASEVDKTEMPDLSQIKEESSTECQKEQRKREQEVTKKSLEKDDEPKKDITDSKEDVLKGDMEDLVNTKGVEIRKDSESSDGMSCREGDVLSPKDMVGAVRVRPVRASSEDSMDISSRTCSSPDNKVATPKPIKPKPPKVVLEMVPERRNSYDHLLKHVKKELHSPTHEQKNTPRRRHSSKKDFVVPSTSTKKRQSSGSSEKNSEIDTPVRPKRTVAGKKRKVIESEETETESEPETPAKKKKLLDSTPTGKAKGKRSLKVKSLCDSTGQFSLPTPVNSFPCRQPTKSQSSRSFGSRSASRVGQLGYESLTKSQSFHNYVDSLEFSTSAHQRSLMAFTLPPDLVTSMITFASLVKSEPEKL